METVKLENDIKVFYITASSFPDGIEDAHQKLHTIVPNSPNRRFFGVSRPENGGEIIYRAAAEEMSPGEGESLNCDTLTLKKGNYVSLTLYDFVKDISSIERAFKKLLSYPNIDPQGYCVELYLSEKDVKCMVRLND